MKIYRHGNLKWCYEAEKEINSAVNLEIFMINELNKVSGKFQFIYPVD